MTRNLTREKRCLYLDFRTESGVEVLLEALVSFRAV